jgi:prepilin-type N-terminal cleavage/methylation domain-containing protein
MKNHSAFTLIELSIVLVIIGLVISSIVLAKDMIDSSEARAQVKQFQEFQTAINGFKLKYNCLPGDCAEANSLGLGTNGNGNGILQTNTAAFSSTETPDGHYDGEFPQFFLHLKASGLVQQKLDGLFSGGGSYPLLAIGSGGMIAAGRYQSGSTGTIPNFITDAFRFPDGFWLHAIICNPSTNPMLSNDGCGVMTPAQAFQIDSKIDDGRPISGKVWGYSSAAAPIPSSPCLNGSYTSYNLANTNTHCQMSYKIQ